MIRSPSHGCSRISLSSSEVNWTLLGEDVDRDPDHPDVVEAEARRKLGVGNELRRDPLGEPASQARDAVGVGRRLSEAAAPVVVQLERPRERLVDGGCNRRVDPASGGRLRRGRVFVVDGRHVVAAARPGFVHWARTRSIVSLRRRRLTRSRHSRPRRPRLPFARQLRGHRPPANHPFGVPAWQTTNRHPLAWRRDPLCAPLAAGYGRWPSRLVRRLRDEGGVALVPRAAPAAAVPSSGNAAPARIAHAHPNGGRSFVIA